MIHKTVAIFKRGARSWERGHISSDKHIEQVVRETWWLLGFIPLYVRDNVHTTNL